MAKRSGAVMPNLNGWSHAAKSWTRDDWLCIETIDAHTAGEPLRIYVDGFPPPIGETILQRRQHAQSRLDKYRTSTLWEPRGHADMYGCLIVPPERENSDFGVLFLHNEGYSSMCGHGIIAVAKVAVQVGWIKSNQNPIPIHIDSPAGLISARVYMKNHETVERVSFENVTSFVAALDQQVKIDGFGNVRYDLAYGGAFYAFVNADELDLELTPSNLPKLIELGRTIKSIAKDNATIRHPEQDDLSFLYGTIFTGKAHNSANYSRHVCIFADGEVDRSPTGTGVSGRAAILYAKRQIEIGIPIRIESIIDSTFDVSVKHESLCGDVKGIVPDVTGNAYITGRHQFVVDPDDPLQNGFFLR